MMNHFAGRMLLMICKGSGIFSTGNINPLNIKVGSIVPTRETSIAVCCVSVKIEMTIPIKRLVMIKIMLIPKSKNKFPLMGKSKTVTLKIKIETKMIIDKMK